MEITTTFGDRLKHAWSVFRGNDVITNDDFGYSSHIPPNRSRRRGSHEMSIVNAMFNRIAIDVASMSIRHVRTNDEGAYKEDIKSSLNYCLTIESNIDQTSRELIQDIVMSLFDEGSVAVIPVETTIDPEKSGSYEIHSLRTGKILEWYPKHVLVEVYNEDTGLRENVMIAKKTAAIIENPLYSIVNEPNSTLQRLIRKLNLLDVIDEQSGSGKLDLIIQLPYVIKNEARRKEAEKRRNDIERQLTGSKYGIAYTDGTERITQINRAVENNLMQQVQYLLGMVQGQFGYTEAVFNGTASESEMLNYVSRTIEPVLSAIVDEFRRKFLTKTARSQNQSIMYFRNIFRLVPANELANIADRFTRNEILSSNEMRAIMGMPPSSNPKADELVNKNINQPRKESAGFDNDQTIQIFETLLKNPETMDDLDPQYRDIINDVISAISKKITK